MVSKEREMRRFAGACRFVFNRALARQNENYEAGINTFPIQKWLHGSLSGNLTQRHNG